MAREKRARAFVEGGVVVSDLSDQELRRVFDEIGFVTASNATLPLLRQAIRAADISDIAVLIEGETGTGKQVLANAIHRLDQKRSSQQFVTVHCATINEALAESELFGHERGAFSGAVNTRKGLFQTAHGGTLLLDDVSDLPLQVQTKLLDVLQRGIVRAVGSDREARVDVRIIATVNRNLEEMVRQKAFRTDLYYRLNVVHLCLPPLRDRSEDLCALILAFAQRHRNVFAGITQVEPELIAHLAQRRFEGNVRELEHCVQRMLFVKAEGKTLGLRDWMAQCSNDEGSTSGELINEAARTLWKAISKAGVPCAAALRLAERNILELAISDSPQTRRELASRLRTSERTLYHKLKSHRLTGGAASR
jgi:DNA-binding NtrC family response regulator